MLFITIIFTEFYVWKWEIGLLVKKKHDEERNSSSISDVTSQLFQTKRQSCKRLKDFVNGVVVSPTLFR